MKVVLPIAHQNGQNYTPTKQQGKYQHMSFCNLRDNHNFPVYKHSRVVLLKSHKSVCKDNAFFHLYGFLWGNYING
jgi:hypothetical protein